MARPGVKAALGSGAFYSDIQYPLGSNYINDGSKALKAHLTLEDLFLRDFQVQAPEVQWISATEIIYKSRDGNIMKLNIQANQTELLMKNTTFVTFKASKVAVSPDLNYVLLTYDIKKVYRYSFLASYLIYNLHTREVHELNPPEVSDSVLQFASWGVCGQQLIYVFENNIYYKPDVKSSSLRLTSSGQEGLVFNGIPDWLYEEEVLHSPVAHWWSLSGSNLAFLTINDTLVPNMLLQRFTGSLYPQGIRYPYPKFGQVNPTVKLHVVTLNDSSPTIELLPPSSLEKSAYYISMVRWVTEEHLTVRWLNRAQNTSILTHCSIHSGECERKHVITSDKWIDGQNEEPVFSKDGATFFITLPIKHGSQGSFRHLTMMSEQHTDGEISVRHLTSGNWEVTKMLAYDESLKAMVRTVDLFHRECLTCFLFKPQCSYFDAMLSPDLQTQVSERFHLDWDSVLSSSDNVIVARLDGRGSGFQGQKNLQEVHKRLGVVELQDQLTALEYLVKQPYIDSSRVGVFGKAYGGFLSSLLLLSHNSPFRCGVAMAPVSDWRLYGSAFTERYFGYEAKDEYKYQISSLLSNISISEKQTFLILHGTADASVHFQHTAELVKMLSMHNVNYTLQIFPDEGHDISSKHYILSSVISFFRKCFHENNAFTMETAEED
ncbi:Inactive dipeptidyl peptidase 10 [Bagarius yarrelli]|uniref:Inactive dipeptidyl peptidase 10 n=1 Tax=Bagarius yarrelli TaxID=175774 RepID=A0A556TW32_BAGYA|nr:Inactive dipeptidyl peptidase 10 [Bagarius yarrelli]